MADDKGGFVGFEEREGFGLLGDGCRGEGLHASNIGSERGEEGCVERGIIDWDQVFDQGGRFESQRHCCFGAPRKSVSSMHI